MNKVFLFVIGIFFITQTQAQLLNEVGIFVGGTNYSGDIGREFYVFPNKIGGSLIYKRNINSRVVARGGYSYLPIRDNDKYSTNPVRKDRGLSFVNTIHELSLGIEFNYFEYDVLSHYNAITPYVFVEFAGIGYQTAINYTSTKLRINYAIPFGIGYKSKISDQLGYAVELRGNYTFVDDLDYSDHNNDDYPNLKFGNPNTNDWYFFTGVSLTYSFGRPNCFVPRN